VVVVAYYAYEGLDMETLAVVGASLGDVSAAEQPAIMASPAAYSLFAIDDRPIVLIGPP
jgi:hypothetical protein